MAALASPAGLAVGQHRSELVISIRFGRCRLEYRHGFPESLGADLDVQFTIALLANVIDKAVWTAAANMRIGYPGARPEHKDLFPLAQNLYAAETGHIEFDDTLLRSPMRTSDAALCATVRAAMAGIDQMSKAAPDFPKLVKLLLSSSVRETYAPIKLNQAAQLLGCPARTLQEYLKRGGTSCARLRTQARCEIASEALARGHSIDETAAMVGYAQRQTFSEAFTEWRGTPPSVFASRARLG